MTALEPWPSESHWNKAVARAYWAHALLKHSHGYLEVSVLQISAWRVQIYLLGNSALNSIRWSFFPSMIRRLIFTIDLYLGRQWCASNKNSKNNEERLQGLGMTAYGIRSTKSGLLSPSLWKWWEKKQREEMSACFWDSCHCWDFGFFTHELIYITHVLLATERIQRKWKKILAQELAEILGKALN